MALLQSALTVHRGPRLNLRDATVNTSFFFPRRKSARSCSSDSLADVPSVIRDSLPFPECDPPFSTFAVGNSLIHRGFYRSSRNQSFLIRWVISLPPLSTSLVKSDPPFPFKSFPLRRGPREFGPRAAFALARFNQAPNFWRIFTLPAPFFPLREITGFYQIDAGRQIWGYGKFFLRGPLHPPLPPPATHNKLPTPTLPLAAPCAN